MKTKIRISALALTAALFCALFITSCAQNAITSSIVIAIGSPARSADSATTYSYSLTIMEEIQENEENFFHETIEGTFTGNSVTLTADAPVGKTVRIELSIYNEESRFTFRTENPVTISAGINNVTLVRDEGEDGGTETGKTVTDAASEDEEGLVSMGETSYNTLYEAFSKVTEKSGTVTLTLNKDALVVGTLPVAEGAKIRLDLNGHTLYWVSAENGPLIRATANSTVAVISSAQSSAKILYGTLYPQRYQTSYSVFEADSKSTLALENVTIGNNTILGVFWYNGTDAAIITAKENSSVFLSGVTITGNYATATGNKGMIYAKNARLYAKNTSLTTNLGYWSSGIYLDNSEFAFVGGTIKADVPATGDSLSALLNLTQNASALYVTSSGKEGTDKVFLSNTTLFSTRTTLPVVQVVNGAHLNMANGIVWSEFDFDSLTASDTNDATGAVEYTPGNRILESDEKYTLIYANEKEGTIDNTIHVLKLGTKEDDTSFLHLGDNSGVIGVIDLYGKSQIHITSPNDFSVKTTNANSGATSDYNTIASINFINGVDFYKYETITAEDGRTTVSTNVYDLRPILIYSSVVGAFTSTQEAAKYYASHFILQNTDEDTDKSSYTYGWGYLDDTASESGTNVILFPKREAKASSGN